jgi:uncharacterized protein (DUF885 family)
MSKETQPDDWLLIEAARQANITNWEKDDLRYYYDNGRTFRALCDMIQQHEAFKQEVSDAVFDYFQTESDAASKRLCAFIIPKSDPLANRRLACALEAIESIRGRATHAVIAIRAIELYEQGFGK